MKTPLIAAFAALIIGIAAVGCTPSESAAPSTDTSTPSPEKKEEGETATTTTAEMVKCDGCGKEVAKADIHAHDGKNLCAACDSH